MILTVDQHFPCSWNKTLRITGTRGENKRSVFYCSFSDLLMIVPSWKTLDTGLFAKRWSRLHHHLKDVENISGLNLLLIKFVVITYWSEMHKRLPKTLACVAGAKRGGGGGGRKGIPLPFFPSSLPPTPSPPPLSTPAMQATKSQRNCRQHVGTPKKDRLHLKFTVVSR